MEKHPTKLDRLMHAVAEHHPLRATLEFALDDVGVRIESNSEELIAKLHKHFLRYVTKLKTCELSLVAIEAPEPELNLPFQEPQVYPDKGGADEQHADIDGGRVTRKIKTGLQFLLGSDMTLAVGACVDNQNEIVKLVNERRALLLARV